MSFISASAYVPPSVPKINKIDGLTVITVPCSREQNAQYCTILDEAAKENGSASEKVKLKLEGSKPADNANNFSGYELVNYQKFVGRSTTHWSRLAAWKSTSQMLCIPILPYTTSIKEGVIAKAGLPVNVETDIIFCMSHIPNVTINTLAMRNKHYYYKMTIPEKEFLKAVGRRAGDIAQAIKTSTKMPTDLKESFAKTIDQDGKELQAWILDGSKKVSKTNYFRRIFENKCSPFVVAYGESDIQSKSGLVNQTVKEQYKAYIVRQKSYFGYDAPEDEDGENIIGKSWIRYSDGGSWNIMFNEASIKSMNTPGMRDRTLSVFPNKTDCKVKAVNGKLTLLTGSCDVKMRSAQCIGSSSSCKENVRNNYSSESLQSDEIERCFNNVPSLNFAKRAVCELTSTQDGTTKLQYALFKSYYENKRGPSPFLFKDFKNKAKDLLKRELPYAFYGPTYFPNGKSNEEKIKSELGLKDQQIQIAGGNLATPKNIIRAEVFIGDNLYKTITNVVEGKTEEYEYTYDATSNTDSFKLTQKVVDAINQANSGNKLVEVQLVYDCEPSRDIRVAKRAMCVVSGENHQLRPAKLEWDYETIAREADGSVNVTPYNISLGSNIEIRGKFYKIVKGIDTLVESTPFTELTQAWITDGVVTGIPNPYNISKERVDKREHRLTYNYECKEIRPCTNPSSDTCKEKNLNMNNEGNIDEHGSRSLTEAQEDTTKAKTYTYKSEPTAFGEVKHNSYSDSRYKELWNASAGVPHDETLFVDIGSSIISMEAQSPKENFDIVELQEQELEITQDITDQNLITIEAPISGRSAPGGGCEGDDVTFQISACSGSYETEWSESCGTEENPKTCCRAGSKTVSTRDKFGVKFQLPSIKVFANYISGFNVKIPEKANITSPNFTGSMTLAAQSKTVEVDSRDKGSIKLVGWEESVSACSHLSSCEKEAEWQYCVMKNVMKRYADKEIYVEYTPPWKNIHLIDVPHPTLGPGHHLRYKLLADNRIIFTRPDARPGEQLGEGALHGQLEFVPDVYVERKTTNNDMSFKDESNNFGYPEINASNIDSFPKVSAPNSPSTAMARLGANYKCKPHDLASKKVASPFTSDGGSGSKTSDEYYSNMNGATYYEYPDMNYPNKGRKLRKAIIQDHMYPYAVYGKSTEPGFELNLQQGSFCRYKVTYNKLENVCRYWGKYRCGKGRGGDDYCCLNVEREAGLEAVLNFKPDEVIYGVTGDIDHDCDEAIEEIQDSNWHWEKQYILNFAGVSDPGDDFTFNITGIERQEVFPDECLERRTPKECPMKCNKIFNYATISGDTESMNSETSFLPEAEKWDTRNYFPIIGYNGFYDNSSADRRGFREPLFYGEGYTITSLHNGLKTGNNAVVDYSLATSGGPEYSVPGMFDQSSSMEVDVNYSREIKGLNDFVVHSPISITDIAISTPVLRDHRIFSQQRTLDKSNPKGVIRFTPGTHFKLNMINQFESDGTIGSQGVAEATTEKGVNYQQGLLVNRWIKERWVRLPMDVIYIGPTISDGNQTITNGEKYNRGSAIPLARNNVATGSGDDVTYDFFIPEDVDETVYYNENNGIQGWVVAKNVEPPEGYPDKKDRDNFERGSLFNASHTAYFAKPAEVVGRLGNFTWNYTTDPGWQNYFREPKASGGYVIDKLVKEPEMLKQKYYVGSRYGMFELYPFTGNLNGSIREDINRYGTQRIAGIPIYKRKPVSGTLYNQLCPNTSADPLSVVKSIGKHPIKVGYPINFTLQSIGNYNHPSTRLYITPEYYLAKVASDTCSDEGASYYRNVQFSSEERLKVYALGKDNKYKRIDDRFDEEFMHVTKVLDQKDNLVGTGEVIGSSAVKKRDIGFGSNYFSILNYPQLGTGLHSSEKIQKWYGMIKLPSSSKFILATNHSDNVSKYALNESDMKDKVLLIKLRINALGPVWALSAGMGNMNIPTDSGKVRQIVNTQLNWGGHDLPADMPDTSPPTPPYVPGTFPNPEVDNPPELAEEPQNSGTPADVKVPTNRGGNAYKGIDAFEMTMPPTNIGMSSAVHRPHVTPAIGEEPDMIISNMLTYDSLVLQANQSLIDVPQASDKNNVKKNTTMMPIRPINFFEPNGTTLTNPDDAVNEYKNPTGSNWYKVSPVEPIYVNKVVVRTNERVTTNVRPYTPVYNNRPPNISAGNKVYNPFDPSSWRSNEPPVPGSPNNYPGLPPGSDIPDAFVPWVPTYPGTTPQQPKVSIPPSVQPPQPIPHMPTVPPSHEPPIPTTGIDVPQQPPTVPPVDYPPEPGIIIDINNSSDKDVRVKGTW